MNFQLNPTILAFYKPYLLSFQHAYHKNPGQFLSRGAFWVALIIFLYVSSKNVLTEYQRFQDGSHFILPEMTEMKPLMKGRSLSVPEIIEMHVFGSEVIKPKSIDGLSAEAGLSAPITSLSLTLKGVFTAEDPKEASAIIAGGEGEVEDKHYKVGAVLPGSAVLRQVSKDRVVIEYQGRLESLWLYEPVDNRNQVGLPNPTSQTIDKRSDHALSQVLSHYHHLLQTEPMEILTLLRFAPTEIKGRMAGFQIKPGAKQAEFAMLGFRENDRVTAINDIPLDGAEKGIEVLEQVKHASELAVEVERNGQKLKYLYRLKEL